MKFFYIGAFQEDSVFLNKSNKMPFHTAQQSLEKQILVGLQENNCDVLINSLNQSEVSKKKLYVNKIHSEKINYYFYINLPIIKELFYFFITLFRSTLFCIKNRGTNRVILSTFTYFPVSIATKLVSIFFEVKRVNIFTDLSQDILNEERQKETNMGTFKRLILPMYLKGLSYIDNSYDGYVLISFPMLEKINKNKKPYIIMEGISDNSILFHNIDTTKKIEKKIITYSGTLSEEYGIQNIIDAFNACNFNNNYELWFIGRGSGEKLVDDASKRNINIKNKGFMSKEELFEILKESRLLVNFRNPNDSYTKYSFPSKTFEYLLSETPFLTTKLKGIPNEYDEYLFYADNNIESLSKSMIDLVDSNCEEIAQKVIRGKNFIVEEKNRMVQINKIIKFCQSLF